MPFTLGTRMNRYEIGSLIGEGGMGEVYLARDTSLGRPAAIKVLKESLSGNKEYWHRFKREAQAVSALNHPNILTIYEMEQWGGRPYIATEFIEGVTLRKRLKEGLKDACEALELATQITSALVAAHKAGIIHRDIKPENVMVRDDGYVKVLDFGLAKLAEDIRSDFRACAPAGDQSTVTLHTDPRAVIGTVGYMSPEHLRGFELDGRTDVWSLGVVLYEMLAARPPFDGPTRSDKIVAVLERDPPPLAAYAHGVPAELQRIVRKCLAKDREARYATALDLYEDLKAAKRELESGSGGAGWPRPAAEEKVDAGGRTAATVRQRRAALTGPHERTRALLASSLRAAPWAWLLVLVLAAGAGIFTYKSFTRREAARPAAEVRVVNLTNSGVAIAGAISPDGRYVAYVQENGESQALAVRGVNTGDSVTLAQPGRFSYAGVTFSPDGDYVYYVRREGTDVGQLYQTPLIGGGARKLLSGVDSPVSFSPDGRSIAFVRVDAARGEQNLLVAAADGTGERVVATRPKGERFSERGAAWSPGGRSLVYGVGRWDYSGGFHTDLVEASIEDGAERPVASQRWFSIFQVAWRGQSELLVNASLGALGPVQIWKVSYPGGAVERATNDLNDYVGISLSADGASLVTVQNNRTKTIWVAPRDGVRQERQIEKAAGASYGIAWTPDGRIIFSSMAGSSLNLSAINADGSGRRQLTGGAGDNYHPSVSRDGRYIVFSSNRGGAFNIWRMSAEDGSGPTQLTDGGADFYPYCSPDGRWVYYEHQSNGAPTVWRVPMDGGPASPLTDKYAGTPVVSPDGRFVACRYYITGETRGIAILPAEGGEPVKLLAIPVINWQRVRWSPDGLALYYTGESGGVYNIWSQPVDGGPPTRVTELNGEQIFSYEWSPDMKLLACERGVEISDVVMLGGR